MKGRWTDFDRYLTARALGDRRATVTISDVRIIDTHPRPGKTERAPLLLFAGKSKGLIVSSSNRRVLADLFGDDVEQCIGKQIALKVVEVQVGRETKRPIRIFAAEPAAPIEVMKEAAATSRVN